MSKFKLGVGFADFLVTDSAVRSGRVKEERSVDLPRLSAWLWVGVVLVMGLLLVRLVGLQIFEGGKYRVLADENRILRIRLPAKRGSIYDRNRNVLAKDVQVSKVHAGTKLQIDAWEREYTVGTATAHVLGYVGEISKDEVGLISQSGGKYETGSVMGRGGIEQQYENELRGRDGGRLVEVDSGGEVVREMGKQAASEGRDLTLTVDESLQQLALESMNNKKGAVVVSNPKNGEILALVSSPSFDPNKVGTQYSVLSAQKDLPFFNRAIGGVFVPGSTFKIVTTVAALMEQKLDEGFIYNDTGIITVGNFSYTNWFFTMRGRTEGIIGWKKAIARSTDTFFYKVGELIGPEVMAKWAEILGLGEKTGIDLPGEVAGLIPTPDWKLKTKNEKWFLGNTYHMAIGQGDILLTPLQVNVMTNVVAANGMKCVPHLVNNAPSDPPLNLRGGRQGVICEKVDISPETFEIIKDGMIGACSGGGTAFPLFDFKPQVACKTGTAEYMKPDGKIGTHAWLTAFAPAEDPTVSVTVLVEGGGEGSSVAAPIARKILAKYFGVEDTYNYAAISGEGE